MDPSMPTPFPDAVPADLFNQSFVLYDSLGDAFPVTLDDVDVYIYNGIVQSIVLASQIGAAFAILVVLLMLTKTDKRRLPVFWLNTMALVLSIVDQILYCLYYTGPWYGPYAYLSGDFTYVPHSAKAVSAAAEIIALFTQICLEASLVLQVWVVCVTLQHSRRAMIMIASIAVAMLAIAFRLAQVIVNISVNIIQEKPTTRYAWYAQTRDITLTISICFFSAIFCAKLGWAMYQRKKLGLTQFGPIQIIFIGGTQTLIVPVVCAALQFGSPQIRASSLILTVTVICLPLTSLWAAASTDRPEKATRGPDAHRRFLVGSADGSKPSKSSGGRGHDMYSAGSEARTPVYDRFENSRAVEKDLEMQDLQRID